MKPRFRFRRGSRGAARFPDQQMKPIRLAIIRVDLHAFWYAPFMVKCDLVKLLEHSSVCHRFFADMWRPTSTLVIKRQPGFRLVNVYDGTPGNDGRPEKFVETFTDRPRLCTSLEEATRDVDAAYIADCSRDGSDHLELASPFLKRGIPTFVDKPFAATFKDAKAMIALARRHQTPLMSASILSYTDQVKWLLKRKDEIGPWSLGLIKGANGWDTESGLEGICHGVALALATFGYGVDWVQCMGNLPQEFMLLHYADDRQIMVMNAAGEISGKGFTVQVWGRNTTPNLPAGNDLTSEPICDPEMLSATAEIVKLFKKMVRTRTPPIPYEHILEWVRIIEAGQRSQRLNKRVYLSQVR